MPAPSAFRPRCPHIARRSSRPWERLRRASVRLSVMAVLPLFSVLGCGGGAPADVTLLWRLSMAAPASIPPSSAPSPRSKARPRRRSTKAAAASARKQPPAASRRRPSAHILPARRDPQQAPHLPRRSPHRKPVPPSSRPSFTTPGTVGEAVRREPRRIGVPMSEIARGLLVGLGLRLGCVAVSSVGW